MWWELKSINRWQDQDKPRVCAEISTPEQYIVSLNHRWMENYSEVDDSVQNMHMSKVSCFVFIIHDGFVRCIYPYHFRELTTLRKVHLFQGTLLRFFAFKIKLIAFTFIKTCWWKIEILCRQICIMLRKNVLMQDFTYLLPIYFLTMIPGHPSTLHCLSTACTCLLGPV